jgi:phosphatidate cytidylyltransferase
MAFNWQSFKTRTLTAAIFVVVMLAGLLINRWTFFILFSVIHFGCWWEYLKLTEKIFKTQIGKVTKYVLMGTGYILFWLMAYGNDHTIDPGISIGSTAISLKWILYSLIFICIAIFLLQNKKLPWQAKWLSAGGLLYISLSLGLMMDLYGKTDVRIHDTRAVIASAFFFPFIIIASLWINDTMAYIIGSLIGKTPLSKISPKKTWEGTIGGIVLSVGVIWILCNYIFHYGTLSYFIMVIAAIASIAGTFGDLLESKLKRIAGVKDSGHIMPGHGGFLDRFDSLLIAVPFVWLFIHFFMQ